MIKALIVAGAASQAAYWAHHLGLWPNEWRYAHTAHGVRGIRQIPVYLVGTYWERDDWPDVLDYLTALDITPILAEEMVPRG